MPRTCFITGKRTRTVKTSLRSGSPKKRGGVGLKRTGVRKRTQKPNLHEEDALAGWQSPTGLGEYQSAAGPRAVAAGRA